ncbi:MAG: 23S rRNA (guanosine(2251)-2'-O)-methyltransferase RlmB [Nitrospirae bacterium]|nr:23S rRNA (guanosine(2251)-2'-O)-methyltransferase RlmB [Nitrospirota bacterium]MBI3351455.1 23S rRNA (guanosine(2251)-2'-O)-methyltransferase RlmB [Nitrospirota bacterium]
MHPMLEALRAKGRSFSQIYIQKGKKESSLKEMIQLAKEQNIRVTYAAKEILDQISGTLKHQGVLGLGASKRYDTIDHLLEHSRQTGEPAFFLILDEIEDPRNLGAILRTAEGAGIHGVILPTRRSAGITETVAKTSAGAIEYVKVVQVVNIVQTIEFLKTQGIWVYGLDGEAKATYLQMDYTAPAAFVLGAEGKGLRPLVKQTCDMTISIPMRGKVQSLNVSTAAGIVVYEVLRQRAKISK